MANQSLFIRSQSALTTPIKDELVMFDSDAGKYYGFNQVASAIWNHLEKAMTINMLCKRLTGEFDISYDQCHKEVIEFLPRLIKRGLIEVRS